MFGLALTWEAKRAVSGHEQLRELRPGPGGKARQRVHVYHEYGEGPRDSARDDAELLSPCSLDAKAFPGYSGYIPQRISETAHLDWRTPQAAQVNDAVPNSYGRALAGWSPFVPGRVAETVHGHIGMANTWKSMATREYFDTYHAEKPQFPRGMSEPVPNPYVGPYEDLNLSKARQSGAPTMPSSGPTPRADHADDRPMMTLHTLY